MESCIKHAYRQSSGNTEHRKESLTRSSVVNCMLASGFDVPKVVAMDVTDKPGNSIQQIKQFIGENFADREEYNNIYSDAPLLAMTRGGATLINLSSLGR